VLLIAETFVRINFNALNLVIGSLIEHRESSPRALIIKGRVVMTLRSSGHDIHLWLKSYFLIKRVWQEGKSIDVKEKAGEAESKVPAWQFPPGFRHVNKFIKTGA
jgi:hypothetical protein